MEDRLYEMLKKLRPEFDFRSSSDFVEDGYLDSFDVVSIVAEIEEEYHILVDGLDVIPENFSSVHAMIKLIEKSREKTK